MGRYINLELPVLIEKNFLARADRRGIFGYFMGGHGALVTVLRHPERWHSVSGVGCQRFDGEILVDQGLGDDFLKRELHPEALEFVANHSGQKLRLRWPAGYDHMITATI